VDEPRIAGSLWSIPRSEQRHKAVSAARAGVHILHWDVADGTLGPVGGFGPSEAKDIARMAGVRSEAHLMVSNPLAHVDAWATWCELVVVHIESRDWKAALKRIAAHGVLPGIAVSPGTELSIIPDDAQAVLIMSVEPGHAGAPFTAAAFQRTAALRTTLTLPRMVGLDGGVKRSHAALAAQAGANWLVSGTDLFRAENMSDWVSGCTADLTPRVRSKPESLDAR